MTQSPTHATPASKTLAEHRELHALLDEIQQASASPTIAEVAQSLVGRLDDLRERLAAHFDGEERSGLFEQIRELAPEQAHECAKLCDEHLSLLKRVDHLRAAETEVRQSPEWLAGVRVLLSELSRHEAAENELLTRVLDGGDQAQD
jgi:hypothetical protein